MTNRPSQNDPPSPTRKPWAALTLAFCLPLAWFGAGCRAVQTVADLPGQAAGTVTPGKKHPQAVDAVELQRSLLRFADEFAASMVAGVEKLRRGTNVLDPAEVLQWKITLVTETCAIATGPSPVANLLDMIVFVTVARTALEEQWQPKVFGASAQAMLENCRNAETEIWACASRVLSPEQQAELRAAIEAWCRRNPMPDNVRELGLQGYATQVAQTNQAGTAKPGSVFSLLQLDPLSGLDPARGQGARGEGSGVSERQRAV